MEICGKVHPMLRLKLFRWWLNVFCRFFLFFFVWPVGEIYLSHWFFNVPGIRSNILKNEISFYFHAIIKFIPYYRQR